MTALAVSFHYRPCLISTSIDMDVIQHCLALAPVPGLSAAFSVFRYIWTFVQQIQTSKQQLLCLASMIAQLLQTLDHQYRSGRFSEARMSVQLKDLCW